MEREITYTNRKGRTYHLCEVVTKNGKTRFVFSRESRGRPVTEMPAGYESAETVNGQVFLRKIGSSPILDTEVECVRTALRRRPHLANFRVDTKKDTIVIYESRGSIDPETLQGIGFSSRAERILGASSGYSPELRFKLMDPQSRTFSVERMCYRSSREGWLPLHVTGTLETLADSYLKHLGKESFFDLF